MNQKIRVYHIEKRPVIQKLVHDILARDTEITHVGSMDIQHLGDEPVNFNDIDIMLIGINQDDLVQGNWESRLSLCNAIRSNYPDIRFVVHSIYNADNIKQLASTGFHGLVSKLTGSFEIRDAIHAVAEAGKYICKQTCLVFKNILEVINGKTEFVSINQKLFSAREIEVLNLLACGLTSRQIAYQLRLSPKTIETHRKKLIEKSFISNSAQLITFGFLHGFI